MAESTQYAGEFKLEKVIITTHDNKTFDLTAQVVEINVFEELMSTSVSATITVVDTQNIVSDAPIVGQEYIQLLIRTPNFRGISAINYVDHVMVVRKVAYNVDQNQGKTYMLELTTPEFFKNNRVRVSQAYEGRYSDAVKKIFQDETYLNSKKNLIVEKTLENQKVIIPNMHPFSAIQMLAQRSISETHNNASSFMFYETTKGFHFRTFESLIDREPFTEGTPGFTAGRPDDFEESGLTPLEKSFLRIEEFQVTANGDVTTNIKGGLFASKLILHDAYNKNYQTYEYSYADQFSQDLHLDRNPVFPYTDSVDETGNSVSDYPDARLHIASTSSIENADAGKSFVAGTYPEHTNPYVDNNIDKWLLNRQSRILQLLKGFQMQLIVNGNTALQVGDLIQVNIPTSGVGSDDLYDPYYTGKYIITKLRHFFSITDQKHRVIMEVSKESVRTAIPSRLPTMSQGTGKVTEL